MNIAIIEDEEVHMKLLAAYLAAWSKEKNIAINISHFPSAESFLFKWEENNDFDILFIDIQMKAMNGMEMARKLRQEDEAVSIVFTTGITDYMQEGYDVEAMQYLIKPIDEEKIRKCMDKVITKCKVTKYLLVHTRDEVIKLDENGINYIEARGHSAVIEALGRNNEAMRLEVTESISELERLLDEKSFIKCHRSYICNIKNIHHIDKRDIHFDNGSSIPVSRRMYDKVNQVFIEYFRKGVRSI